MANIDDRWTSPGNNGQRLPNARHGSGRRWRARYYDSSGRQHAQHFDRKIDAQRWLDSVTTAVGTGSYVDPNRSKVTLGVVPDYLFEGKGMRIDGITEGRPASKAGLHVGDVVVKLGAIDVSDMMSYMKALAAFNKGDTAPVIVVREGKEVEVQVTF